LVDESGLKGLSCVFLPDVLCSYRKGKRSGVMGKCFECLYYEKFMSEMEKEEEKEDVAFLAEFDHVNRFANCLFADCFCDGELGKLVCFGGKLVGGVVEVWKCRRFDVEKLKVGSAMREAYLGLVGGVAP